jgi:hypothetical protein
VLQDSVEHCGLYFEKPCVVGSEGVLSIEKGPHLVHVFSTSVSRYLFRSYQADARVVFATDLEPSYFVCVYSFEFVVVLDVLGRRFRDRVLAVDFEDIGWGVRLCNGRGVVDECKEGGNEEGDKGEAAKDVDEEKRTQAAIHL